MEKKAGRWIVAAVLVALGANFLFGKSGVVTVLRTRHETKVLQAQVEAEKQKRDSLIIVRDRLKSDPAYIERVVREELGYCLPNETVVKIVAEELDE